MEGYERRYLEISPFFYNQGVRDAKARTITAFADLTEQMEYLEKMAPKKPGKGPSRG